MFYCVVGVSNTNSCILVYYCNHRNMATRHYNSMTSSPSSSTSHSCCAGAGAGAGAGARERSGVADTPPSGAPGAVACDPNVRGPVEGPLNRGSPPNRGPPLSLGPPVARGPPDARGPPASRDAPLLVNERGALKRCTPEGWSLTPADHRRAGAGALLAGLVVNGWISVDGERGGGVTDRRSGDAPEWISQSASDIEHSEWSVSAWLAHSSSSGGSGPTYACCHRARILVVVKRTSCPW